ncbi:hypothetical protein [Metapseudomonas otitidis]|uniref:Uncharacterized protein n=2 Tax=Metapseudomonas otitidis TaxID=319939 RepID=A0ABU3XU55_9GAMM|nr:hypothetical protein [Pseudomonas otitidis]MDH0334792.1 hypothetical protein [Pseudomonas otitidis]MDV3441465.1 hypothetical protein [Pseudomonas otitidis]WMR32417.1 hypothetical protein QT513_25130 [Pseudomonas otitidis]
MTELTQTTFARRFAQVPDSRLLQADKSTEAPLMCMPEVEEQTEYYLSIEHGEGADRGMWTGALGEGAVFFGLIAIVPLLLDGDMQWASRLALFTYPPVLAVFLWEILQPMPLPILLNRRTRELYFEQDGELYHTPWDGIAAAAYPFDTVGLYTGGMRHAALEVLLHRYGHPEEQVVINLGSPIGKSLEMQLGFWEYLRAYMEHGPWFDEQGQRSDTPERVDELREVRSSKGQSVRLYWGLIKAEYHANNGRNFLSYADAVLLLGSILLLPMRTLQNLTYGIAKRRARTQWPALVRERLRADGPTSRLVDLEQQA